MANTTIQLKKSLVPGNIPSSLAAGELAINTADGILFYRDPNNSIKQFSSGTTANSFSTINVGSTILVATSPTDILSLYGNNGITISGNFINDTIQIGVNSANTTQQGVVQLYDGVDSNSTILAATANSVNTAYNLAQLALASVNTTVSSLTTNYKTQEFAATANQTLFVVTGGYTPDYISVYLNGVMLSTTDYTATDGSTVLLNFGTNPADSVVVGKWFFDSGIFISAQQTVDEYTATANQTSFSTTAIYTAGYIKVYRNGILLEKNDYSAPGGFGVTINYPIPENDIIAIEHWGAFNTMNTTPVWMRANAAYNQSNAAYNAANTYLINTDSAFQQANNAYTKANTKLDALSYGDIKSNSFTTSSNTANQVLDIFSTSLYRSVKYTIQVTSSSDYQVSEIMLLQNGTASYISEYGLVTTSGVLMSYDADIDSGNARLLMSPTNNINSIKLVKTLVVV